MQTNTIGSRFILLGFACLGLSVLFGLTASLQYVFPHLLPDTLTFRYTRPLHVFLAVNWIFSCVTGIIYQYMPAAAGRPLHSPLLAGWHFILVAATILIAITGFCTGHFSGREYLEFPPWVSIVIVCYWTMFMVNFFATVRPRLSTAPVYIWSWCTGLIFFLITITEAHLWLLPFFNHNIIRDVTIQWKANGSMVGAWNMLIYGTAMFAMEQISGNKQMGHQKVSFAFYFLGLTNLLFNWGHHTYVVPASPAIKEVSYIISMTELVLLANIIIKWKKSMSGNISSLAQRFFRSADRWILLNLTLAIAISVPWINQYTHGTQVTVAHAMGATIGINTMLLLASVAFLFDGRVTGKNQRIIGAGLRLLNSSLFLLWCSLLIAGIVRGIATTQNLYFVRLQEQMMPWLRSFSASGALLVVGILMILIPYLKPVISRRQ